MCRVRLGWIQTWLMPSRWVSLQEFHRFPELPNWKVGNNQTLSKFLAGGGGEVECP